MKDFTDIRFGQDRRLEEVARMLCSSAISIIRNMDRPELRSIILSDRNPNVELTSTQRTRSDEGISKSSRSLCREDPCTTLRTGPVYVWLRPDHHKGGLCRSQARIFDQSAAFKHCHSSRTRKDTRGIIALGRISQWRGGRLADISYGNRR